MGRQLFPPSDAGLLAWSLNFNTLITATPTAYGLTAALATAYGTLHTTYATALAACDPAVRNKGAVAAKNTARTNLKTDARLLAGLVNNTASVTTAQKLTLGLNVRPSPSPIPVPSTSPDLDVVSVSTFTVKIRLHDAASSGKRGKPPGVLGGTVFSWVGATPPADPALWKFEGSTGRADTTVVFPSTVAAGSKVWLTAFWFNGRKQSGPACTPVVVTLQGSAISSVAA